MSIGRERMRRKLVLTLMGILLVTWTAAQGKSAPGLPSEDTVTSFLHQTFGYDSTITWKILSIKPSQAEGLSEVTVALSNPQGQQVTTLYVTPDGKHALTGELLPFGAKPYEPAKQALLKGINGVSR